MIEQTKKLRLDELQVDSFVTTTTGTSGTNDIVGGSVTDFYYGPICVDTQDVFNCHGSAVDTFDGNGTACNRPGNVKTAAFACTFQNCVISAEASCIIGNQTVEYQCPTGGWGGGADTCQC